MTNPDLASEQQIMLSAIDYLENAKSASNRIMGTVDEALVTLSSGMISASGGQLGKAIQQWKERFFDIIANIQKMEDALQETVSGVKNNEDHNNELASSVITNAIVR